MDRKLLFISPLKRAIHLRSLGALRDMAALDLASVGLRAEEFFFKAGAHLTNPGERLTRFHIIADGNVRVSGDEHGDALLTTDATLGLLTLLSRSEVGLTAVAETDVVTLSLSNDDLLDLFEDKFSIILSQIRALAGMMLDERKRIASGTHLAPSDGRPVPTRLGDHDLVDRLLFMRQRGVFEHANVEALIGIASEMRQIDLAAGTRLWGIGEPSGWLFSIVNGRVRCTTEDGRQFTCGNGYPLGHLESQCRAPRWYEAVTETDVFGLRGETDTFLDIMEQHFEMAADYVASMAEGLMRMLAAKHGDNRTMPGRRGFGD